MKRIISAILAAMLALLAALPASANGNGGTIEEHTVIWSEASGGKISLITTTAYEELPTADQIPPAYIFEYSAASSVTQPLSDGSEKGDELLKAAMSGKKIPVGTVITVEYGGVDESYPAQIAPSKVTFCAERTDILLSQVQPVIDMLNGITKTEKYTISPEDTANFDIITDFTVVGSVYNEKTKRYDLAISMKAKHFSTAENKELWYYTTSNISVSEEGGISISNDGTKKGKQEFNNLLGGNGHVTYGTVVELRWNGMIQESYPPQLCGIRELRFTGKQTDYSREEIEQERSAMNEMFVGDAPHYPAEAESDVGGVPVNIPEGNLFQGVSPDADKNPSTGTDKVFAGTALVGVLAWAASLISLKREKGEKSK